MNNVFYLNSNTFRWFLDSHVDPVNKMSTVLKEDDPSMDSPIKAKNFDIKTKASLPQSDLPQHEQESHEPEEDPVLQDLVVDGKVDPKEVTSFLHEMYASHISRTQDEEEERPVMEVVLEASSLLVNEFAMVSADQTVLEIIQGELDEYIFPRISLLYVDISAIQASDVAKLVSFAELYNKTLVKKGMTVSKDRLADFEELANEYLRRGVHDQMHLMIRNSLRLRNEEETKLNRQGHLVTGHPEDIAFMIEMQIAVARQHLPPRFLGEVLTACNHELSNMIADIMLDVGSRWSKIEVERLCVIINDASRMIEGCEERNNALLDRNNSEHQKAGEDLCRELMELSLHATRFLCERIMLDLREPDPILTRIGGMAWETGAILITEITVATLKDYSDDISEWISESYYFPKVLRHCFDMTLQAYFESFFTMTMSKGIKDPEVASRILHQDWQNLHQFFCGSGMTEYIGRAGHYTKQVIESRLGLIQAMSFILTPTIPPDKLKSNINTVLMQFGTEVGVAAVLHLAGLRSRRINESEAMEWHAVVGETMLTFMSEEASKSKPPYTLPDLRDSEYIIRVRTVNRKESEDSALRTLSKHPSKRKGLGASFRKSARRMLKSDRTLLSTWKTPPEEEMWQEKPELSKPAQSERNLGGNELAQRKIRTKR